MNSWPLYSAAPWCSRGAGCTARAGGSGSQRPSSSEKAHTSVKEPYTSLRPPWMTMRLLPCMAATWPLRGRGAGPAGTGGPAQVQGPGHMTMGAPALGQHWQPAAGCCACGPSLTSALACLRVMQQRPVDAKLAGGVACGIRGQPDRQVAGRRLPTAWQQAGASAPAPLLLECNEGASCGYARPCILARAPHRSWTGSPSTHRLGGGHPPAARQTTVPRACRPHPAWAA